MRRLVLIFTLFLLTSSIFAQISISSVSNDFYSLDYNLRKKVWNLYEKKGDSWILIFNETGFSITLDSIEYKESQLVFHPPFSEIRIEDPLGTGKCLKISFSDRKKKFLLTSFITLYDNIPVLSIDFSLKNISTDTLILNKINIIDLIDDNSSIFSKYKENAKLLIDGFQSWSNSEVLDFRNANGKTSYWNTAFYSKKDDFFKIFGYLTYVKSENKFKFDFFEDKINFISTVDFYKKILYPDDILKTDKLAIISGSDIYSTLQEYANYTYKTTNEINLNDFSFIKSNIDLNDVPTGWCSWYYYYSDVTQQDVITNLDIAKNEFKEHGFDYIQIDDGYQVSAGDWQTNEKFPDRHRWLVRQIHNAGLKAALWVAPFAISEKSPVFINHPEWLLENEQGEKIMVWDNPKWGGKIYILDPSHPDAYQWLANLFSEITNTWNYDYVKIDFLYYATLGRKYYQNVTPIEAYRLGLRAIREGVGPDKFILGCGAPLHPSIGFVDGMRIGSDISTSWEAVIRCAANTANRFFLNMNVWNNDPDCIVVRPPLNYVQASAWASFVSLSGGMNLFSDDLKELNSERIDILKKTIPVYNKSFIPVDMFNLREDYPPELFHMSYNIEDEYTYIAGIFNWRNKVSTYNLSFSDLKVPYWGAYLVYDYWENKFIGELKDSLSVTLNPTSCKILSIKRKLNKPQIISTSRHITQGVIDLKNVKWNNEIKIFNAISDNLILGDDYSVVIYIPDELDFVECKSNFDHKITQLEENVIRITFKVIRKTFEWSLIFE